MNPKIEEWLKTQCDNKNLHGSLNEERVSECLEIIRLAVECLERTAKNFPFDDSANVCLAEIEKIIGGGE